MLFRCLIFLTLNFSALALGGFLMGDSVSSDWYQNLNKAPWTPPGWVFGTAWTTIMICFTIYMTLVWDFIEKKNHFAALFALQWLLNIFWNPLFFQYHYLALSFIEIIILTIIVGYFLFGYWQQIKTKSLLMLPYFCWLLIASSLNFYAFWYN
ncbi:MAG: tryptophan-rich sensory protein [Saprospiraceae bacterium]|nr:tryptophan-rich sensory protein [Saprospiraceae bacterium]